ncbi:unnamed protein product [Adineta ricciae]|uniref:Uncharacterized protein n=1 Tax=Adineta ricciae TaxID=249248 RepID=A0A814LF46_ADIRI|nr:unnamed protein product [Adineta ricciae]
MDDTVTVNDNSSTAISHQQHSDPNENVPDNVHPKLDFISTSNGNMESTETSVHTPTNTLIPDQALNHTVNGMSRLSMNSNMFYPNSDRFRPQNTPSYYPSNVNTSDHRAQLAAFTPPLMSIPLPYHESQWQPRNYQYSPRPYVPNQSNAKTSSIPKKKPESIAPPVEYYVDCFASNFSDKPLSNTAKSKTKHVTFQESEATNESLRSIANNNLFSPPPPLSVPTYQSTPHFNTYNYSHQQFPYHNFYSSYSGMTANPRYMPRSRGMYMMSRAQRWPPRLYNPNFYQQQHHTSYMYPTYEQRQLYDPNQPKLNSISESQNSFTVIRNIAPKHKKKFDQTSSNESSTPDSMPARPITILRKPSADTGSVVTEEPSASSDIPSNTEQTRLIPPEASEILSPPETTNLLQSLTSQALLSILQSANCISALNEFAQQNKLIINYEFSSASSSKFTCTMTISGRQFPSSSPCSTKNEAQKLACDQALRTLYYESSVAERSQLEFSDKHDYIAHRSLTKFQDLNVNELLHGRKTLACMLMVTDGQFEQAFVISIGTGNACLDETILSYANDGKVLHDCHAEVLARRGLIRFLFVQIQQCQDKQTSIFQYDSTTSKYQLQENITFHMYISSTPCGNASLSTSSKVIRYKQGQTEGTTLASASSLKYPIKSCSDKISRWNIIGIQGGLLIHLLTKPIYLETITLACESTFDRNHVKYSLSEHLNEHVQLLPEPFIYHSPDIDCPKTKSFQQERQVAKLQTSAFAWNITQPDRNELLEPMIGKLKANRSISSLSKYEFFVDFTNFLQTTLPEGIDLPYKTYQEAKQLDPLYLKAKSRISAAFQTESSDANIPWLSKSDQLEQFSIE